MIWALLSLSVKAENKFKDPDYLISIYSPYNLINKFQPKLLPGVYLHIKT